jgi:hypothetical protein
MTTDLPENYKVKGNRYTLTYISPYGVEVGVTTENSDGGYQYMLVEVSIDGDTHSPDIDEKNEYLIGDLVEELREARERIEALETASAWLQSKVREETEGIKEFLVDLDENSHQ